ncbi:alpha/beta fold hydrolase [Cryobacterium luteum]|uniref:Alpha/beta hydrolase n=1 Tax=Cryobacterium luteum TaxID=1424661 RepID=A0A1H8LRT8_9MICO|nr:alpha/beta hydrolase [Cryobacterium luteum]TFB82417.1 alpha/beta hydrolase [Cryobacterium luteum]SEO07810.1 Pimeloyl-ACP methyl ester carboxylesterase [Cryobacterium luteum]
MAAFSDSIMISNDVKLCVETYGDRSDPSVLLIAGMSASMLWWPGEVCEAIASSGFFVIRYDQRDTGRSTNFPRGRPGYSTHDLATDALGICDSLGIRSTHVVGHSMGSMIATILAVDHSDRLRSVTLMGATTGAPDLPSGTGGSPDLPDDLESRLAVIDYLLEDTRACDGLSPRFDEDRIRRFIARDVDRADDIAATISNHPAMEFTRPRRGDVGAISIPALVVHGEIDSIFPLAHGEAVARAIPGAAFVMVPGAGHTLLTADQADFTTPLISHLQATDHR